jgi:hypothetical protein
LRLLPVLFALLLPRASPAVDHSHAKLDTTLAEFLTDGLVDYGALQASAQDPESAFRRYLLDLASEPPEAESTWSRDERLAYWINAYNAFTLKLIVDHYPTGMRWWAKTLPFIRKWIPANSILQIEGRWDRIMFDSVRGPITLNAIEHEILRPEFEDPRIHFAIVCASIGCPRLRSTAFHARQLGAELDDATTDFIADPAKVSFDGETGELRVSKIFDWFRTDFDRPPAGALPNPDTESYGKNAGVARWLAAHGPPKLRARIDRGPFRLEHLPYDWHLNEQPPAASPGER